MHGTPRRAERDTLYGNGTRTRARYDARVATRQRAGRTTGGSLRPQDLGIGQLFWRIREAVVVADVGTEQVVLWNPAAERLFGYTADEAVGLRLDALVPTALRDLHHAGIRRYSAEGRGRLVDSDATIELPARHKDGRDVPIEMTLSSVERVDGAAGR